MGAPHCLYSSSYLGRSRGAARAFEQQLGGDRRRESRDALTQQLDALAPRRARAWAEALESDGSGVGDRKRTRPAAPAAPAAAVTAATSVTACAACAASASMASAAAAARGVGGARRGDGGELAGQAREKEVRLLDDQSEHRAP